MEDYQATIYYFHLFPRLEAYKMLHRKLVINETLGK